MLGGCRRQIARNTCNFSTQHNCLSMGNGDPSIVMKIKHELDIEYENKQKLSNKNTTQNNE